MNTSSTKIVPVAVLRGYKKGNRDAVCSTYALNLTDLPHGGWASQGLIEKARLVAVRVGSNEHTSAISNSAIA